MLLILWMRLMSTTIGFEVCFDCYWCEHQSSVRLRAWVDDADVDAAAAVDADIARADWQ